MWQIKILLNGTFWNVFQYFWSGVGWTLTYGTRDMEGRLYVPQFLYLPIYQWALKLFPYIDYCENFCYAHEGADIAFISVFVSSGFDLSLYIKSYMDYMIVLIFRNLYRGFTNLHSHKTVHMGSLFFKFMSSLFYFISLW